MIGQLAIGLADGISSFNPFHIRVFNPFSNDFYQKLLANLPDEVFYQELPHRDAMGTRKVLALKPSRLIHLPPAIQLFWMDLAKDLCSDKVAYLFRRTLAIEGPMHPGPMLLRDVSGYKIKPHPDTKMKVATIQAYLPVDDSQKHLGTSFYSKQGNEFKLETTVPFIPNLAYAFKVTESSWHGTEFGAFTGVRNTLMMTYYREPFDMF